MVLFCLVFGRCIYYYTNTHPSPFRTLLLYRGLNGLFWFIMGGCSRGHSPLIFRLVDIGLYIVLLCVFFERLIYDKRGTATPSYFPTFSHIFPHFVWIFPPFVWNLCSFWNVFQTIFRCHWWCMVYVVEL